MSKSVFEIIKSRRSVRTFDGKGLAAAERGEIEKMLAQCENPFGVEVKMLLLDKKEHGLSSPVVIGEDAYISAKVRRSEHYEIAYGYTFEAACVGALSLGYGTVMLAATFNRPAFESALGVAEGEFVPAASPIGRTAAKMSLRETIMRKGAKSDTRLPFEELFFGGSFAKPLPFGDAGIFADALEACRLAPSATNRQPWRAVVCGDLVHFFEKRSMKDNPLGDVQKIDVGIGLCHFDLVMKEEGHTGSFIFDDPKIGLPDRTEYIVTYQIN